MAYKPAPVAASNFQTSDDGWFGGIYTNSYSVPLPASPAITYQLLPKNMNYTTPASPVANAGYYFQAPPSYLGNMSRLYGGSLYFSLSLNKAPTAASITLVHSPTSLVLVSGSNIIGIDIFTGKTDPAPGQTNAQYELSIPIDEGHGWQSLSSSDGSWSSSTAADIQTTLSNLTGILILGNCANDLQSTALNSVSVAPKELPGEPMPLEVHTINVSQGDSILVVNRDLYALENKIDQWISTQPSPKPTKPTSAGDWMPFANAKNINIAGTIRDAVLIDAGDKEFGLNVINYLKKQGVEKEKYSVVTSHFHGDHYDGLIYRQSKKSMVPSNPNTVFWQHPPSAIYDCGNDSKFDPLTYKSSKGNAITHYKSNIHTLCTKAPGTAATYHALKPNDSIDIGTPADPMRLYCVAANGFVWTGLTSKSHRPVGAKKDEQNSRSVGLVLEYSEYRYYLAGDLGGADSKESSQSEGEDYGTKQAVGSKGYWDIEVPLAGYLPAIYKKPAGRPRTVAGHICCLKSSHHGSQWHTNTKLLRTIQPTVCVFSSGLKKSFHKHPTQEVLDRVDYDTSQQESKNIYSPKWPDRTSGAPSTTPQVDNSLKNNGSGGNYSYFVTEMKKNISTGKKKSRFNRQLPNGKVVGTIVIRPYLTDILNIIQNPATDSDIRIQIYGSGDTSDIYNTKKYASNLRPPESKNANYPATVYYPVGPWLHICNKH